MKKYKVGMYGGKFMPFHKGHLHCLKVASEECEKVYAILFYGGEDEVRIAKEHPEEYEYGYLNPGVRLNNLINICSQFVNVVPCFVDISECRLPDGAEDWEAETPLVIECCDGVPNAVYGSEHSYEDYFNRAYPGAVVRVVDPVRIDYPISGTMLREMNWEEREKWTVL